MQQVKAVFIGGALWRSRLLASSVPADASVGKTSMLITYTGNAFPYPECALPQMTCFYAHLFHLPDVPRTVEIMSASCCTRRS